jgi:hypothetical protein
MLLVGGCDSRATCSWSRLTVFLLRRLLGVLFVTEARSMERGVQWSPMKSESWSGWFLLKSSPTCSCHWLHYDLQNVPHENAKCAAGTVCANWSEASWLLTDWTELCRLLNCLEADPIVNTARNSSCIVAIVRHHENPVYRSVAWIPISESVTLLPKFLICGRFPWEAPTDVKNQHFHPAACNLVHWLPRYASTIIYRCIALLQLLYRWQHQSLKLWYHFVGPVFCRAYGQRLKVSHLRVHRFIQTTLQHSVKHCRDLQSTEQLRT